jgi:predicted MFS family arabinose efflux permease
VVSGTLAGLWSWRAGFWALAPPALLLAAAVWRLPEPVRGGEGRLEDGGRVAEGHAGGGDSEPIEERVADAGIRPDPELVVEEDPQRLSLRQAVGYVLRIRTNLVLIVASALGYFYLAGIQTFAVEFLRTRYGVGQTAGSLLVVVIGAGGLVGALVGGRLADHWLERGRISARVLVAAGAYGLAAALFVPGLLATSLAVSVAIWIAAAGMLAASNPPLDAARLDVLHPRLWGRGEGARTLVRQLAVAAAPLTFGLVSDALAGGDSTSDIARGLQYTFLIMLVPLAAAGAILLWGARRYPVDVATAAASGRGRGPGPSHG